MDRSEWLKKTRAQCQALYDRIAPLYWDTYGFYDNQTHLEFLRKFFSRLAPDSSILSAACGAGRYDGLLLDAGHRVLGIDQSAGMLARARQHFPAADYPGLRYDHIGLQEMDFQAEFDGAICLDALENVPPEDWPSIMASFARALTPGGWLYFTVETPNPQELRESFEKSTAMGLPVVYGELADQLNADYEKYKDMDPREIARSGAIISVYHYYPSENQVRAWLSGTGLTITETGTGHWYQHYLARKSS